MNDSEFPVNRAIVLKVLAQSMLTSCSQNPANQRIDANDANAGKRDFVQENA